MHCHLDLYPNPFHVASECGKRGLYVLSVTTTPKAWEGTKKLENGGDRIRTALGLHPQLAHQRFNELELFDALLPEAKYIGEIGLDGGKGFKEHWKVQLEVFRHILKSVSVDGGRIMSIHSRLCASAVLEELKDFTGIPILHWFTGTKKELKRAIDIGCLFSVGPAMLDTKKGKELVAIIPKEKILTETDGPFVKVSGETLMPWDVNSTYLVLSKFWGLSEIEAQLQINLNLQKILLSV